MSIYRIQKGVGTVKLSRAVFLYIEHELYSYDATKRSLVELREDIIDETPLPEVMVSGGTTPNPTERKAARLVQNAALARMERVIRAVERALGRLTESHRQLFELKYLQSLEWPQVCDEMAISERSFFRLRRDLVLMAAEELGLGE